MFWDLQAQFESTVQFPQWQKEKALDHAALMSNPLWYLERFAVKNLSAFEPSWQLTNPLWVPSMFWDLQSHLILAVQFLQWQKEKALDHAA